VLERVAEQMLAWRVSGLLPTFVAVNISLSQCRRGDLVTVVDDIATRLACGLDWLELEVTEHLFLPPGIDDCLVTLRRLSSLGVTISIDDFGAGYSSLGRLRSLPVDKVKIDKSFIAELGKSRQAEMIVRAIISLARSVKMTVTAEGVETDQQLKFLIAEGCDCAQGYYLSRPLPQNEFTAMLRNYARGVELLRLGRTA
jgi:EAL domain-containing protein (putative c-di-GMP-specific phosphodiesterase class I)